MQKIHVCDAKLLTVRVQYAYENTRTKIRVSYAYRTRIDTGTETRFLVDDPAATNTTYTKEGGLWTPRSDTILRVHDAVVDADPEGALN